MLCSVSFPFMKRIGVQTRVQTAAVGQGHFVLGRLGFPDLDMRDLSVKCMGMKRLGVSERSNFLETAT